MLAERFVAFRDREEALKAELRTYKSILDVCPCPMALMTRDGLAEYVNPSYCAMLGVTLEDIVENGWHNVVAPEDLERTAKNWEKVVKNQLHDFASWSLLKTPTGVIKAYWRTTLLPDNGYVIVVFHPECAFLRDQGFCLFSANEPGVVQE